MLSLGDDVGAWHGPMPWSTPCWSSAVKVILHVPGSMPSTRATPVPSVLPSVVLPSGAVIR